MKQNHAPHSSARHAPRPFWRRRFSRGFSALGLVLISLALILASPRDGSAAWPADPGGDIPWLTSCGLSGVSSIECAFNYGREQENPSLPDITLPSQAQWDCMDAGARALWLINQEREARGVDPLHGLEANVMGVAQDYADYLLAHNVFGHYEDGRDPWERLHDNPAIGACHDFLSVAENLACFITSGTSIALPVERSVYNWMYVDATHSWGHRHAVLWYPYNDNGGPTGMEGFLGIGQASGPYMGWNYGVVVVMNVFDPCDDWYYPPEVATEEATDLLHESVGKVTATLNGRINPLGTPTDVYFEYWAAGSPGTVYATAPADAGEGLDPLSVSAVVNGLPDNTTYGFRLVGDNGVGLYEGGDRILCTAILYVDCQDNDDCGEDYFAPCYDPHIQNAVDDAAPGATIKIAQGTYYEDDSNPRANVDLYKDAILELGLTSSYDAPSPTTTIIEPGTPGAPTLAISNGRVILWGGVELR